MITIRTITIIGATGTMGANVAGIFASFGNAKVYCVGRDVDKVKKAIPRIIKSVRADSVAKNLIPADFSNIPECIAASDLIFESIVEDIDLKIKVAKTIANLMKPNAISCTGSSGLSITQIAECYPAKLRSHFFGVHMFNPPYSMTLCELIPTKYSDGRLKKELLDYLKNILLRTVVEVKDSPAFLANRIGFQFINEALQYAEKYKDFGGIDYIDSILGPFTGRSMAPIATADFVGLDVHKAIVNNLKKNTNDFANETFVLPQYVQTLIGDGKLGKKVEEGLYKTIKYDDGTKKYLVFDISSGTYREIINYVFPFSEKMKNNIQNGDYECAFKVLVTDQSVEAKICIHFLIKYIAYAIFCAHEVGYTEKNADDVMATGFNWCPPLALLKELKKERNFETLVDEEYKELLSTRTLSDYDFRPFFKSGRQA